MLQTAKSPQEVEDLILHDANFPPRNLLFRNGKVAIEGIERWMWEEAQTTEKKIKMLHTWSKLVIKNVVHLRIDYDRRAPLIEDVTILWLECAASDILGLRQDGEKKTAYDIRILGIPVNYTIRVTGIDVKLEDTEREVEIIDADDREEKDLKQFLKQFEQPVGYQAKSEHKRSQFAVGARVRWSGKEWKVRAVYPAYIGKTDADHTFYYKLQSRGNRFYEQELEAVENKD